LETFRAGKHQEIQTNLAENTELLQQSSPYCSSNHSAKMFYHKIREAFLKLQYHGRLDQDMLNKTKNISFKDFFKLPLKITA